MSHRTRLSVSLLLALSLLALMGIAACTREKPAPTASWLGATPTALFGQTAVTPGALQSPAAAAATSAPGPLPTVTPALISPTQAVPTARVIVPTPAPYTSEPETEPETEPGSETGGDTFTYIVDPGDTLFSIATHYGTTVDVLVELNNLADAESIVVGQELQIPIGGTGEGEAELPEEEPEEPAEEPVTVVHVVQEGETLYSICQEYGAEMYSVMEANGMTDADTLFVGQELIIPAGAQTETPAEGETAEPSEPETYVVQAGDRLIDIALSYGISLEALQEANGITDPNMIYPGQELLIP